MGFIHNVIIKNTVLYSIGEITPRVIGFLLLPVYTHYLNPSDYGIMSYTQSVIVFLYVFGSLALNTFTLRYYFEYGEETNKKKLIGTIHLTIVLFNLFILLGSFIMMPTIIRYYGIQVPWNPFFRLAFIINFLESFTIIPMIVYRVRQEALIFVALGVSRSILTVILTLYFLIILDYGLLGFYYAQLFCVLLYALIYSFVVKKYGKWSLDISIVKEGLKFSAPLIPGVICYQLLSVSDRIILERNVKIDELGIYNVACTLSLALNVIIQSGYKSFEPEIFKRYGKQCFYDFVMKVQKIFLLFIDLGALTICLYSQEIFFFMTSEGFHSGYLLVPLVIVGVVFSGQNIIYGAILQCEKRTKIQGIVAIVGAIVSVSMNLILIPLWGVYAAAFSSAASYLVMNILIFKSMTFPGKSMSRELLLVALIPLFSFGAYTVFPNMSITTFLAKGAFLMMYLFFIKYILNVNIETIKLSEI